MSFQLEPDELEESSLSIGDYVGICPRCLKAGESYEHSQLSFWHESRCPHCDQRTQLWCPRCARHRVLKL